MLPPQLDKIDFFDVSPDWSGDVDGCQVILLDVAKCFFDCFNRLGLAKPLFLLLIASQMNSLWWFLSEAF